MTVPPDVRGALRSLRRSPAFLGLAVLTLGLGAGATGAMYTLLRQVVLESLPMRSEESVVVSWGNHLTRGFDRFPYSHAAFERIEEGATGVERLAATDAWAPSERLIEDGGGLAPSRWSRVMGDFFGVVGVEPLLGRTLEAADDAVGGARVAVVSHGFWMRRFGGDASVLGSTLRVNDETYSVVGVLPGEFDYPRGTEVWYPMRTTFDAGSADPPRLELRLLARLAPGVPGERFASEIERVLDGDADLAVAYGDVAPVVRPFREVMLGDMRPVVMLLFSGAVLLLVVAFVNVANLVLIRSIDRGVAWSIRRALGANRGQLTVVPVIEALVITLLAGVTGVLIMVGGLGAILPLAPGGLPILDGVHPDAASWLVLAGVLAICGSLLAVIPLWHGRGPLDAAGVLRSGERSVGQHGKGRIAVVAGQAALAVWAVVAAALLVRSLSNLRSLDTGFDESGLHVVQLNHRYDIFAEPVPADWPDRLSSAVQWIERQPGVVAATPVLVPPLVVNGGYDFVPALEGDVSPDRSLPYLNFETVTPGYFETLRLPILRGRAIETSDVDGSQPVAVVNEAAARALWPGEDPLGKRMVMPWPGYREVVWTVVGVAVDARYRALLEVRPSVYVPLRQMGLFAARWIAVRTRAPVDLASTVGDAFATADPSVRVVGATPVHERMSEPLARPRFALTVLGAIAGVILTLAAVGAYGVMSAGVRGRTRELGVRLACGATPANIGGLVLREGVTMTTAGAMIGAAGALATGGYIQSLLFGVDSNDPLVLVAAVLIVVSTALMACVSPALMAARTDPLTVLRSDT